jgi:hypothetical protein
MRTLLHENTVDRLWTERPEAAAREESKVLPDLVGRGFLGRSPERIRRGLYSSQPKVGLIV